MSKSENLYHAARELIPGGVNSPVRAFTGVGGTPLFIERADGAYLYDVDGKAYIDYVGSWGPMVLGHNHPAIRNAVIEAASRGLSFGAPQTLSRTGQDPLSQLAFTLPLPQQGKPVYGVGSNMQGDVVLVALDEVKAGNMPEEQKKAMVQGITQNNAQIAFEALMSNLRKAAKIKLGDSIDQQQ